VAVNYCTLKAASLLSLKRLQTMKYLRKLFLFLPVMLKQLLSLTVKLRGILSLSRNPHKTRRFCRGSSSRVVIPPAAAKAVVAHRGASVSKQYRSEKQR